MRAHARRARSGVIIVGEGLACGCHNGATVFLTGASRAGHHRSCQACQEARHAGSTTRVLEMDQAFPPPPHHGRHGLLIPRRNTGNSAPSTAGMPSSLEIGTVTVWDCLSPFATEYSPLLYGRPLRCSLVAVAACN
ncbi:hypothetical protein TCDM_12651 [Trypanosoma cruzi Dm28c]|uniref:Uncharacterized protein n=1 Tax=Trypanosoma cruzi Dm28c TaxID=1416333 RepID=V5AQD1_TRYCR|nr:hypothetical protein TCDM_12651 [Trypanosoma cruzi Dm28c]